MKNKYVLFLQVLMLALFILFLNCQQPETKIKTKYKKKVVTVSVEVPVEVIKCTVTFDKRGGTGGSNSATATYGSAMPAVAAPARAGFVFAGYYDAVIGGAQYYNADMSSARNWDKIENTTLYARWDWSVYNLRDTGPAGGLICYINPNAAADNWKYLEAAPQSTEWTSKQWGKYGTSVGGTGTAIGTGKNNTALIVAKLNEAPAETDRAAQLCDALIYGGYNDWFLPSKDELNLMYVNLKQQGVGGFAFDYYWSSSENGSTNSWFQDFTYGSQSNDAKNYDERVRAIRAF